MRSNPIYSNDEYRHRLARTGARARKVYYRAVKMTREALGPEAKVSRLNVLQLAAGALETGSRAFGIAQPWPTLAARLRKIHDDLKAGIAHAEMMKVHAPNNPDTKAMATLADAVTQETKP